MNAQTHAPIDRWFRPLLVAPALALINLSVSLWYLKYRFAGSDAGALMTSAAKILRGSVFYRDIDTYPFPGAPYLLALVMGIFGEHVTVTRVLAALLFCVTVLSLYATALRLVGPRSAALFGLSLMSFKFIAWPSFTSYSYWDTSFCFAMAAIAVLVRHPFRGGSLQLTAAGTLVALSLAAKQSIGLYLGFAAGLVLLFPGAVGFERRNVREMWTELAAFGAGVVLVLLPMLGYFASEGLLDEMLYSGLVRPFTGYLPTSGISFAPPLRWWEFGTLQHLEAFMYFPEPYWTLLRQQQLPARDLYPLFWTLGEIFIRTVYTALPIHFAFGAIVWARTRRKPGPVDARLSMFVLLAAAVVLSVFPRSGFTHVISVYPVVALLGFALWERIGAEGTRRRTISRAIRAAGIASMLALTWWLTVLQHAVLTHHMKLDKADLYIAPDRAYVEYVVKFLRDELREDDLLFVYGHESHYYFLSDHYYPWRFSQLYPGQTGEDGGAELVRVLRANPPKIILRGFLTLKGIPHIDSYTPELAKWMASSAVRDDRMVRRYSPPGGWPMPGYIQAFVHINEVEKWSRERHRRARRK